MHILHMFGCHITQNSAFAYTCKSLVDTRYELLLLTVTTACVHIHTQTHVNTHRITKRNIHQQGCVCIQDDTYTD